MSTKSENRVVFITGASSGIGAALARHLAKKGFRVALAARRVSNLINIITEIQNQGGQAIALECDVRNQTSLEQSVQQTLLNWGRIDIAIANAGYGVVGNFEKLTTTHYQDQFNTNVLGLQRTLWACLAAVKKQKGSLVLMGSVAGHLSLPGNSAYSMSKFAVRALADSLWQELKPQGIAVTLISPGFVKSEIRRVDNSGQLHPTEPHPLPSWMVLDTEVAARQMARGILKRKREVVITKIGKLAVFINQHFPWLVRFIIGKGVRSRQEPSR